MSKQNNNDDNDRTQAWKSADGTVQMVEYLLRGHAARVPGTLWHGWTVGSRGGSSSDDNNNNNNKAVLDALESLDTMHRLLNRMWDEGQFYMTVRKGHYSQLAYEEELKEQEQEKEMDWKRFAREDTVLDDDDDNNDDDDKYASWQSNATEKGADEEDDTKESSMLEDFAMPGPSTAMYDIYLDTLATTAALVGAPQDDVVNAKNALNILEIILYRHELDGGDEYNDNLHTMPTQISYNAVLRTAANLPVQHDNNEGHRDWALMAAFSAHDALTHSALERNSSTFCYLLQVVAKYMHASPARGNISRGLWKMAKKHGWYNEQVQDALLLANTPPNSDEHEAWMNEMIRDKDWVKDAPQRWRRRVQKDRDVPKQTTY